jgi:hypothetical protein
VKIVHTKNDRFAVYPNPVVTNFFTVQFATPQSGQMQAGLYSTSGKKLWATMLNLTSQTVSRTISLPASLPAGMYALVINVNDRQYRQTIMLGSGK